VLRPGLSVDLVWLIQENTVSVHLMELMKLMGLMKTEILKAVDFLVRRQSLLPQAQGDRLPEHIRSKPARSV